MTLSERARAIAHKHSPRCTGGTGHGCGGDGARYHSGTCERLYLDIVHALTDTHNALGARPAISIIGSRSPCPISLWRSTTRAPSMAFAQLKHMPTIHRKAPMIKRDWPAILKDATARGVGVCPLARELGVDRSERASATGSNFQSPRSC
jgi:hypothetical protein